MRRPSALIGVAILALALAACGGGDDADEESTAAAATSPTASAGTVTIDFWHSETAANENSLTDLIDRFNASQDEVRVNLIYQGGISDLELKLFASLGTEDMPALVELAESETQLMIDSRSVQPVQRFIDAEGYDLSDFDEKALDQYRVGEELYAMPLGILVPMLFYSKVDFQEAGLHPDQPPLTLEEIRAYSEKLYKEDSSGNVVRSGIALDIGGWYLRVVLAEHGDLVVNNNNGYDGRATEVLFDNDTGRALFRWWDDMVESGLGMNVGRNPSSADALLAMAADQASMAFTGSAALGPVIEVMESGVGEGELGVALFPGIAGGTGEVGIFARSLWITNGRPEEEQQAAWKLVRWLMEPEQQAEFFAGTGYLPARLSAYDQEASQAAIEEYPQYQLPIDAFVGTPSTPAKLAPRSGALPRIEEIVTDALEAVVVGDKDPDQALEEAAAAATEELQDYNRRVE